MVGNFVDHGDEVVVAGGEVGFGDDFDHGGPVVTGADGDASFTGGTFGPLVHLALALLAEPFFGGGSVTIVFGEGFFAVHHAQAGFFPEGFHVSGSETHSWIPWCGYVGCSGNE